MQLKEEMNRMLKYLEWKSERWMQCTDIRTGLTSDITEEIRVYVQDQADVQTALHMIFVGFRRHHFRLLKMHPVIIMIGRLCNWL